VGRYLAPEDVTAFVDNDASKAEFMGRPVISPAELAGRGADLIVVANRHGAEIAEQCEKLGIDPAKLFYMYDNYYLADRNADYAAAERALGRELTEKVRRSGRIIRSMDGEDVPGGDYVRLKTLSLAAAEIYAGGVPGAAAELGVYRGEFAAEINRLFPDRKLYLFDTFGGFGAAEAAAETEKNSCGQAFLRAHENTDVQRVLARLEKPENAVVMAGLFPESLGGLEERFAFVSLDVDFEESTSRGLEYFYPRLNPGGYLFLHDYNSPDLPGAKRAAARYERNRPRLGGGAITAAKPRGDFKGETACFPLDDPLLLWTGGRRAIRESPPTGDEGRKTGRCACEGRAARRGRRALRCGGRGFPPHQSACADSFPSKSPAPLRRRDYRGEAARRFQGGNSVFPP
jgi:hypothetical protein